MRKIINSKITYFFILVVGILFSYKAFVLNKSSALIYNYENNDLKYYITSNSGTGDARKIYLEANSTKKIAFRITNQNNISTNYEIIYNTDKDISIKKIIGISDDISGVINAYETKIIELAVINKGNENKYVNLDVNVSKTNKDLELSNQINEMYYDDNVTVLAYVDGNYMSTNAFPNNSNYIVSGKCQVNGIEDNNIIINGEYVVNDVKPHWNISILNVTSPNTVCHVDFKQIDW